MLGSQSRKKGRRTSCHSVPCYRIPQGTMSTATTGYHASGYRRVPYQRAPQYTCYRVPQGTMSTGTTGYHVNGYHKVPCIAQRSSSTRPSRVVWASDVITPTRMSPAIFNPLGEVFHLLRTPDRCVELLTRGQGCSCSERLLRWQVHLTDVKSMNCSTEVYN